MLAAALGALPKESVYRVKGFVRLADGPRLRILNWAFGRSELVEVDEDEGAAKGGGDDAGTTRASRLLSRSSRDAANAPV